MDREPPLVDVIGFLAEQVEELSIDHGNQEVEGRIVVTHDEKESGFPVADGVECELVVSHDVLINHTVSRPVRAMQDKMIFSDGDQAVPPHLAEFLG